MAQERKSRRFRIAAAVAMWLSITAIALFASCGTPERENGNSLYGGNQVPQLAGTPPQPLQRQGTTTDGSVAKTKPVENAQSAPARRANPQQSEVKGIYVSGPAAGSVKKMNRLIRLADRTEINAMVIDVKNDAGRITYDSAVPLAGRIGADRGAPIRDIQALLKRLKDHRIYTIGRVVVFKDPYLAAKLPHLAMRGKTGGTRRNRESANWVDPYLQEAQQYVIDIAKEAAQLGFDEIQFDYVRFPADSNNRGTLSPSDKPTKAQAIESFLRAAYRELSPLGVRVSADLFGLTTTADDDMGIGQLWALLADEVDVLSPMVYPSHYAPGVYGLKHPDLHPEEVVRRALMDGIDKNKALPAEKRAEIRPWLQAFTAGWIHPHLDYGKKEIRAQIEAAGKLGIHGYLLWNPKCEYSL